MTTPSLSAARSAPPTPGNLAGRIGTGLRASADAITVHPRVDMHVALDVRGPVGAWVLLETTTPTAPVLLASGIWRIEAPCDRDAWSRQATALVRLLADRLDTLEPDTMLGVTMDGDPSIVSLRALAEWFTAQDRVCGRRHPGFGIPDHARQILRALLDENAPQTLEIWSDGSHGRGSRSGGAGWVDQYGRHGLVAVAARRPVEAELAGVGDALAHLPEWVREVQVNLDSREAVRILDCVLRTGDMGNVPSRSMNEVRSVTAAAHSGVKVSLRWVKGHQGDTMNEIADRLAVFARRSHEAGLTDAAVQAKAAEIVTESMAAATRLGRNRQAA